MVPFLAPLLGSLAGSLLPATLGTGIATSLGLSGATAGLVAAAAPKAIGAGIGTLLAGGDLGDAALNAVGFGAAGALTGGAAAATPTVAGTTAATVPAATVPAAVPAAVPATAPAVDPMKLMQMGGQLMKQNAPPPPVQQAQAQRSAPTQMSANPMLTSAPGVDAMSPGAASMTSSPAGGIAALPAMNNQPMGLQMMTAGLGPNQQGAVNEYLRSQGMVGFA
jgi:hypothetical protein